MSGHERDLPEGAYADTLRLVKMSTELFEQIGRLASPDGSIRVEWGDPVEFIGERPVYSPTIISERKS